MPSGAEQLRDWMDRRGVNQRETAEMLGFHEVYLSQILHLKRVPGLANAIGIERLTGIAAESWLRSELNSEAATDANEPCKPSITNR